MSDTLADAFVALHAEGTQLPAEIHAQATAGAISAERSIAEHVTAGGAAGGLAAGEAIEQGIEEGAERGAREGASEIVEGVAAAGLAAGTVLHEEMLVAGREAGDAAGDIAGRQIASGIAQGGAAGAAALRAELEGVGVGIGGRFGNAFGRGFLDISPGLAVAGGSAIVLAAGIGLAANEALQAEKANVVLTESLFNNAEAASLGYDGYQKLAASLQDLTGFEDEATLAAASQLTQFGLTGEQIERMLPLVADYAARTGRDMPEAAGVLGKSLLGNTRALKEVGISYKATGDLATDFENIMDSLDKKVGGFAKQNAQLLDGQLRKLQANVGDLGETVGGFFLPGLTAAADLLNTGADAAANQAANVSVLDTVLAAAFPGQRAFNDLQSAFTSESSRRDSAMRASISAIGQWSRQLNNGKIEAGEFRERLQTLAASAEELGLSEKDVNAIMRAGRGTLQQYALALAGVTDTRKADIIAIKEQQLAHLALAGGFVGVAANMQSFKDSQDAVVAAQRKVNQLARAGKAGTDAHKQAVADLRDANIAALNSGLSLTESVVQLRNEMRAEDATAEEVREEVRKLGEEYGLNRQQINDLIRDTDRMIKKKEEFAGDVTAHFYAEGLDEIFRKVKDLADILAGIPSALASVGSGPGRSNSMPNDPRQNRTEPGSYPSGGQTNNRMTPMTAVEIELDGKLIYESNEAVGRRQRVRFSGRDDG